MAQPDSALYEALDELADGVVVAGQDGYVLSVSASARALLGALADEKHLRSWADHGLVNATTALPCSPGELPPLRALSGDSPASARLLHAPGGQQARVLECRSSALRGQDQRITGSITLLRDVTAEHEQLVELRRAGTFLDSIVENIPDMVFVKDAERLCFERFNRAGEQLLGMDREELLGKNDYDFFPPEQAAFFQQRDHDTLREGRMLDIREEPIDTRHGRRWLHTKKIPIRDESGVPRYLLGISSDITDRRDAEEELRRAREELEQRVAERTVELKRTQEQLLHAQKLEAVGRLAGGIAHDFNNALAVILGHCSLMRDDAGGNDRLSRGIAVIAGTAQRSATLTRQLLAFSRRQTLQPRTANLNQIVGEARALLEPLLGEDVTLASALDSGLLDVFIDPMLIEQVIVNLAVNARDAMSNGGTLTLRTQNVVLQGSLLDPLPGLREGPHVLLSVEDTGVGMTPEVQARAFEPFFTTKDAAKGTGLGLAMAYGVITQSEGAIRLRSALGKGTSVEIYLPARKGTSQRVSSPLPPNPRDGAGKTVLLVEDQAPLRHLLRDILGEGGYRVLEAADGPSALELASNHDGEIHALVSDVIMPGMTGPQVARQLHQARPGIRTVLMSGYPSNHLAAQDTLTHPVRHLAKPFAPEVLFAALRELLTDKVER